MLKAKIIETGTMNKVYLTWIRNVTKRRETTLKNYFVFVMSTQRLQMSVQSIDQEGTGKTFYIMSFVSFNEDTLICNLYQWSSVCFIVSKK